jgi:hypothetical protein
LDEIGLAVYEEMSFKVNVYRQTMEGCRMKSDHKNSPCHFVTGELKKERKHTNKNNQFNLFFIKKMQMLYIQILPLKFFRICSFISIEVNNHKENLTKTVNQRSQS